MGVYLSSPVTEKDSVDGKCDRFVYGASSMQGWRITQEDAHNCIPLFDEKTKASFFAVYDGHGGSEVAKYCEKHFPEFVKNLMETRDDLEDTTGFIKNAFLEFDATLTTEDVIKELKELAGNDDDNEEDEDDDPVGRTEAELLKEEANMPLDQLLAQYKNTTPEEIKSSHEHLFQIPSLRSKNGSSSSAGSSSQDAQNGPSSSSSSFVSTSSSSSSCKQDSSLQISNGEDRVHNSSETDKSPDLSIVSTSSDCSDKHANTCNNSIVKDITSSTHNNQSSSVTSREPQSPLSPSSTEHDAAENHCSSKLAKRDSHDSLSSESQTSGSTSGVVSSLDINAEPSTSESSSSACVRSSKAKAAIDMALDDGDMDTSDDDDDDDDDEDVWEDASDDDDDDDDDEEEDESENVPMMNTSDEEPGSDSGCTACVVLMQEKKLIVANAGDSRCVLSRAGKAVDLSFDHKPEDDSEKERIENAGGKVTADGRVNGGLNLSRAIGDHVYKRNEELPAEEQMITALPDVETADLCSEDQFIVIACDGIWNYMSSQEVVDFVLEKLKDPEKRQKPSVICEEMFDHCLAPNTHGDGTGCDNMTCIIIVLDTFINSGSQSATPEVAAQPIEADKGIQETSTEQQLSGVNESGDAGSGSLKRCSDDTEIGEEKRLKIKEVA